MKNKKAQPKYVVAFILTQTLYSTNTSKDVKKL